jgi:hypothetical protein
MSSQVGREPCEAPSRLPDSSLNSFPKHFAPLPYIRARPSAEPQRHSLRGFEGGRDPQRTRRILREAFPLLSELALPGTRLFPPIRLSLRHHVVHNVLASDDVVPKRRGFACTQRRSRFALMPLARATDALDTPGCWLAATACALNSSLRFRRLRPGA